MNARQASLIIHHVIDAVYMMSKAFCPKDPIGLVRAATDRLRSLPNVATERGDFKDWSQDSLVKKILNEYRNAKNRTRRREILSWLAATSVKRKWISELFKVSYEVISTARRHANLWGPGGRKVRLSLKKTTYKPSARAAYLKKWLDCNSDHDPAGKKKGGRRLRLLKRHNGYPMYKKDCKRQMPGMQPYSRSQFYSHPLQKDFQDTKCRAGLCTTCNRWGVSVFIDLEQLATEITMLLKPITKFDIGAWKKSFKQVKKYFVRGGMYQSKLKKSSNNIHWCLTYALSHPSDERYQQKCDHDHKEVHTHARVCSCLSLFTRTHLTLNILTLTYRWIQCV